jgi:AcrR family transcriptional regulator
VAIGSPRNARSQRTRTAILVATREILERDGGIAALTMAAVAERAGISRRAVYLHFPTRGELVIGLFHHVNETEGLIESSRPVHEAADAVAALDAWVAHLARYHPRLIPLTRAIERARETDADAAALWSMIMTDWMGACRGLARRLRHEGCLDPQWTVAAAADLLWALMSMDVTDRLVNDRQWSRRRYRTALRTLLRRTLLTDPPPTGGNPMEPAAYPDSGTGDGRGAGG